jgi:hypothetical protein
MIYTAMEAWKGTAWRLLAKCQLLIMYTMLSGHEPVLVYLLLGCDRNTSYRYSHHPFRPMVSTNQLSYYYVY